MYFKYYEDGSNQLAIRESNHVAVRKEGDSYYIAPAEKEGICEVIDASIGRLAVLFRGVEKTVNNVRESGRAECFDTNPVWNQIVTSAPGLEAFRFYETLEEANAEMERIAEAIARGDKLYNFTKER